MKRKMRVKPIVVEVIEDDGMWFDESTCTYYSKDQLEPIEEPKGLDEAANSAIKGICPIVKDGEYFYIRPQLFDVFKAGVKWMAEQGMSFEYEIRGRNTIENLNMDELSKIGVSFNDKVIVHIRKKD